MAVVDRTGLSVSIHAVSASPHEVARVESTFKVRFIEEKPRRLIGDKAYESDKLDALLVAEKVEIIDPSQKEL